MKDGRAFSQGASGILWAAVLLATSIGYGQTTFVDVADEASLVALWELNEASGATSVANAASASYAGTVVGTPTLGVSSAMSTLGTAVDFSGASGNRISVPYAAAINPESYTIEAWAQVQGGAGGYRSPLTSRRSSPTGGYIFYAADNNTWQYWGGPGWATTSGPSVIQDQWVHLAATYNNVSSTRTFYVNGHPVSSGTATLAPNGANPLTIGAGGDSGTDYRFNGAVDNVAVLNQTLAHQSIADHYNAKSNYAARIAAEGPTAYWRLGEQAGTTAYNSVDVASYNGVYSNVSLRQAEIAFADEIDTAASFTGGAAKVTVNHDAALNPAGSFAVEAWARVDGNQGNYRTVLSSRSCSGGFYGFTIYANQTNHWEFRTGTGASAGWSEAIGADVVVGEWAHVVGVYDAASQTQRLYVNGILAATVTSAIYAPTTVNNLFIGMGGDSGTEFAFNGLIDEVALYGHSVTASTVNRHFLQGSNGADFNTWTGTAGDALWSALGNWDSGESAAGKNIVFDDTAASDTAGVVTNTVDADVTVASITFENSEGNYHTTTVNDGNTLAIESASGRGRIYVAQNAHIDGRLAGSQGLVVTGGGTLTLGGAASAMTVAGGVTVADGTLRLDQPDLGFDVGVFTSATPLRVEANGILEIAQKFNVKHSTPITVAGGTLAITANSVEDSSNYINNLHLDGGTVTGNGIRVGYLLADAVFTVTGNATSTISNPIVLVNNVDQTGTRTLTLDVADGSAAYDLVMSGEFRDYAGFTGTDVIKTGAGVLRLDGNLNYTGDTIVNGGVLVLAKSGLLDPAGHPGQFGASGNTVTVNNGATLRLTGWWTMGDGGQHTLIADGGTIDFATSANYQNTITLIGGAITGNSWRNGYHAGDATITVEESDVSSTISGTLTFVKNRSGGLGKTTFEVADGAAEHDLVVSANIVDLSGYAGRSLVKDGPGAMSLSGANTFAGGVNVNAGTLLVNNTTGSGTGTGAVNVSSGATLGGTGTIGGATTIAGGATLATGASVGTLTFDSDLTLQDGARGIGSS